MKITSNFNMHGAIFHHRALTCVTLRTDRKQDGSATHVTNSLDLRQNTEESALLLTVKRTVEKPRFGQL